MNPQSVTLSRVNPQSTILNRVNPQSAILNRVNPQSAISIASIHNPQSRQSAIRNPRSAIHIYESAIRSKIPAAPIPPPTHMLTSPYRDLRRRIS
jgi:hypothetical protein